MEYKYKHITVKNIPEKDTASYQLLLLCLRECDFEDGWVNRNAYGNDMEVFSFSYLAECGIYGTAEEAATRAFKDFGNLADIKIYWAKPGENGGTSAFVLFPSIILRKDLIVVDFVTIDSLMSFEPRDDELYGLYEQIQEVIQP